MATKPQATIEDLYRVSEDGKAELVHGEVVRMSETGDLPNRAAGAIYLSLRLYERPAGRGRAYTDNAGFRVNLPHRGSLSPDAALYVGPRAGGKSLEGAPVFAAEVRSESDYGDKAEKVMAEKRADYFPRARSLSGMWTCSGTSSCASIARSRYRYDVSARRDG